MICKILALFVNTLTVNDKYSLLKREKLKEPIHAQLSEKQELFSEHFSAFLKSRLNFETFQKIMSAL